MELPGPTKISENIYLGAARDAFNLELMEQLRINNLLCCAAQVELPLEVICKMTSVKLFMLDHPDFLIDKFLNISEEMLRTWKRERTFVFCEEGISRSATVVVNYLCENGARLDSALKFVRERRPIVNPNRGFLKTLENKFR